MATSTGVNGTLSANKKGSIAPPPPKDPNANYSEKVEKLRLKKQAKNTPIKQTKVHVKNLPETTTVESLSEIFASVGSVTRSFIVTDKGSSVCNGNAFVIFKDEATAKKAMHLNGVKFSGKHLAVSLAKPKKAKEIAKPETNSLVGQKRALDGTGKGPAKKRPKLDEKRGDKIVEVSGFSSTFVIDEKSIYQDFKKLKLGNPVHVEKKDATTVRIMFISPEDARIAAGKIDGLKYKKNTLSSKLLADPTLQNSRLIVRNLAYKCTKEDLQKEFEKYGTVHEVVIPLNPATLQPHGYGFIQFTDTDEAEKAIEKLNAMKIHGRVISVDWAISQSDYIKSKLKGKMDEESEEEESGDDDDGDEIGDEEMSDDDETESKGKKHKRNESDEDDGEDDDEGDENDEDDGDDDGEGDDEEEAGTINGDDDEEDDVFEFSKYDEDNGIFVRNLSFETTEEDLKQFFSKYGAIKYALVVKNKETNTSKGCAFVRFEDGEDGVELLKTYQELNPPTSLLALPAKGKDRKMGKVFVPTSAPDSTFMLAGRHMSIHPAVSRDEVRSDRRENKKLVKKDARNLQLARFAQIKDTSGFTPDEKRISAQVISERNRQLKSPNIHVSPVRIVVNNLPFKVTEVDIKKYFAEVATLPGQQPPKIKHVRILRDKKTDKSRGFGFVEFIDPATAKQAVKKTNGGMFSGNRIFTSFTLDDMRMRQQAEKKAAKRRDEAKQKAKLSDEYKGAQREKKLKRKLKKLEKELQQGNKDITTNKATTKPTTQKANTKLNTKPKPPQKNK